MVRLLLAVEIDPADAVNSVTLILADPRRYGY
jgi:hypothetical protein